MTDKAIDFFDLESGVPPTVGASIQGEISPKPKASIGLSKKVVGLIFIVIVAVVGIFVLALDKIEQKGQDRVEEAKEAAEQKRETAMAKDTPNDLKAGQVAGAILPTGGAPSTTTADAPAGTTTPATNPLGKSGIVPPESETAAGHGNGALTPEQQAAQFKFQERERRMAEARKSGLESKSYQQATADGTKSAADSAIEALKTRINLPAGAPAVVAGGGQNQALGDQEQKLKFMKEGGVAPTGQHPFTVTEPKSPYELRAGTFIPAILEMGVNSDLPGLVTARVRENVYASVEDQHLLIPSASTLVGSYDSRVALGQSRQLVVWNLLIFPDGKELNLAGMPSADVSGQSGLDADVDNHWLRLFGMTFGMSMVTAGVQLSVPQPATGTNGQSAPLTNAQIVSSALAQQYGQLGAQMLGKYLQVQPTLRNVTGERFNVVVPMKITFPGPWMPKKGVAFSRNS